MDFYRANMAYFYAVDAKYLRAGNEHEKMDIHLYNAIGLAFGPRKNARQANMGGCGF